MANKVDDFRERIKDIFLHKDELENHFQTALELAVSQEELAKLNQTVVKLEKVLASVKNSINERMPHGTTQNGISASPATVEPSSAPVSSGKNGMFARMINKDSVSNNIELAATNPSQLSALNQNASSTSSQLQHKTVTPSAAPVKSAKPVVPPVALPQERPLPQSSRVFNNSSHNAAGDWSTFKKNANIPDTQRVFVLSLSPLTTEESLYNYFSKFGKVVDIKLFTYVDGRPNSAAVGFESNSTVQNVVQHVHVIDAHQITAREYFTKGDESKPKPKSSGKQKNYPKIVLNRYQIFCGGIPVRATRDDIIDGLSYYGEVRDVRMVYPKGANNQNSRVHRGFAFIDMKKQEDAQWMVEKHEPIYILDKEVDCKPNTSPYREDNDGSYSGSMMNLAEEVEAVPVKKEKNKPAAVPGNASPTSRSTESASTPPPSSASATAKPAASSNASVCVICKKNPQNCVLLWCGHGETCMDCGTKLKNCPKSGCGEKIDNRVPVRP